MTKVRNLNSRLEKLETRVFGSHGLTEEQVNKIILVASEEDLGKLIRFKNDAKELNEQLRYFFLSTNMKYRDMNLLKEIKLFSRN